MADNATIGVNLGGVITTSGATNSDVLQSLANFIIAQGYTFETLPKSALPAPPNVFVTLSDDPAIVLDANSPGINTGGFDSTITGGGGNTAIIAQGGNVDYSGGAGQVFATGGTGSIVDAAAAATISAVDGSYGVTGLGANSYNLGGAAASVTASSAGSSRAVLEGNVVYTAGQADTIFATAGASTVFGTTGDVYYGNAAEVYFVGVGTANTVFGGTGADTIYGDGSLFVGGAGNKVFAGSGQDSSAVYAGSGSATIVTGAAGDLVFLQNSQNLVVSGGGVDTIWGTDSGAISPTIFGVNNSYELLVSNMAGGLAIGLGNNTTLDGANTNGGLSYFANPGYGNQTFIGSASGNDTFVVGVQDVGESLVTILNWHAGDTLNLSAFGQADQATAAASLSPGGSGPVPPQRRHHGVVQQRQPPRRTRPAGSSAKRGSLRSPRAPHAVPPHKGAHKGEGEDITAPSPLWGGPGWGVPTKRCETKSCCAVKYYSLRRDDMTTG